MKTLVMESFSMSAAGHLLPLIGSLERMHVNDDSEYDPLDNVNYVAAARNFFLSLCATCEHIHSIEIGAFNTR